MTSFFIYVILALAVTLGIFFALWKFAVKAKKELEEELEMALNTNKVLMEQVSLLREELRIKEENRKKADEKINDLHNGTMSANDILPK